MNSEVAQATTSFGVEATAKVAAKGDATIAAKATIAVNATLAAKAAGKPAANSGAPLRLDLAEIRRLKRNLKPPEDPFLRTIFRNVDATCRLNAPPAIVKKQDEW